MRPEKHEFNKVTEHTQIYETNGHPYFTTVSNVCERCNGGWMSALQNEAKPLVLGLALREWRDYSTEENLTLARWVTMVSISMESYSRQQITAQYQRDVLKAGEMPPGWRIGIFRKANEQNAGYSDHRKVSVPIEMNPGRPVRVQSTFFCIEHVGFHSLSSTGDMVLSMARMSDMNPSIFTERKVWPKAEAASVGATTLYSLGKIKQIQAMFKLGL